MLSWAASFLVAAIVAAIFGFGVVGGVPALLAKSLFGIFLLLFIASVLSALRPTPTIRAYYDGP